MNQKCVGLFILALIGAAITVGVAFLLPKQNALDFFAIVLAVIFGAYFGFAFSGSASKKYVGVEIANIILGIIISLLSLIITPYFLVIGFFWHGLWDLIHHKKVMLAKVDVPEWYVYGCVFYDWAVGALLIWWLSI